jgi:V8-like Glu-specific endopeptidase
MRRTLAPLAVAVFLIAAFTGSAAAYPVSESVDKAAAKVTSYWTAQRMRKAIPADRGIPVPAKPERGGGGRNGGGGGGGGDSSWKSVEVSGPNAHGKVFFTDGGFNYVCSGTAVVSGNESVVLTAGHCVNEGPGGYYTNFSFVPAYRDGNAPLGEFAATRLFTTSGWESSGEFGVDVGAAVVAPSGNQTLTDVVNGEVSVDFNAPRGGSYDIYGYPAAKKFSGQRLRVCRTSWLLDDANGTPATVGAACDMTGGSSGGAWIDASGALVSVTSYYYNSLKNVLFGPHLENEAQTLYTTAAAATP